MIQFILNIAPGGRSGELIRCDDLIPDFKISVEQQAENPKLGLIVAGSSFDDLEKAIKSAIKEAQET